MLYNYLLSLVRTLAPIAAGWLLTQALRLGVTLDSATATSWLTAAFSATYYATFRWAELHRNHRFGRLLGYATPPQYRRGEPQRAPGLG
ncbi:hypothetical protein ACFQLX_16020 [Streptomyces polyrhachis]|uniref:Uncharacterized protein n=1 Tax=Streptomyces polyrhachis TaxID=1282885 RepID=A0ABW2GKS5_9ACTN